jgi:hypothetical protein
MYIDQYFPDLVRAQYVQFPDTVRKARNLLGVSERASGEDLLETLLKKLEPGDRNHVPPNPRRASRLEEQRRCYYGAWRLLGGDDAVYAASCLVKNYGHGK